MEAEKFMTRDAATYELRQKLQHEIFSEIKRNIEIERQTCVNTIGYNEAVIKETAKELEELGWNIDFIYSAQGIDYIRVS